MIVLESVSKAVTYQTDVFFLVKKETQRTPALLALKNTQDFNFLPFKEQFNPGD